ncbi:MAG: class I SAM-dependent methyltransferase [Pirellulales bacterium]
MSSQPAPAANTAPTAPLYTELPYPADGVIRTAHGRIIRAGLAQFAPHLAERRPLRIVDVGCGTGENTSGLAQVFPQAEICGADINPASLELAGKLAQRSGSGVKLVQCDISRTLAERLQDVSPGKFDVVCSIGVLHHLADPSVGFAAVRELIKPDGLFYCMVYTHYGRREEMAVKSLLNEALPAGTSWQARASAIGELGLANIQTLWNGIKTIRRRAKFGPPILPLELVRARIHRNRLVHESDTYSNPCEHLYRFGELRNLLTETGWQFVSLAPHAGLPTRPAEHTRRPRALALLRSMPEDALFDYFAFYYEASGFHFFARPKP